MAIIQQPASLSLLGNLNKFVISSASPVTFTLSEGGAVLADELYEAPLSGSFTIDVSQIVAERLSFQLSSNSFYKQNNIAKTFTANVDSQTVSFTVVRAGVANLADTPTNWLKGNFLTWQPNTKAVSYHSPEWLTYYAVQSSTLKLRATFDDDTTQTITLGSMSAGSAYTANLQYAVVAGLLGNRYPIYFDVWAEGSGTALTYTQRYFYSLPKSELEQWFLFENTLGGIDTIRTSGASDFAGSNTYELAQINDTVTEFSTSVERHYSQNTGALDEYERQWLKDFFPAYRKYVHQNGAFRAIVLIEDEAQYSTSDLPSSFNFTFRFADDTKGLLNLVRNAASIPPTITLPNLSSPNFILPPRLSEYPRVELGEGVILPAFDPYSDTPKVTTVGALIAAAVYEALQQIPGGDGTPGAGGQLVNIIKNDSLSAGTDNDVFSSLRTKTEIDKAIQAFADSIDDHLGGLDSKFLLKLTDDQAQGLITFLKGIKSREITSLAYLPGLLGEGFHIDENGNATFDSITARKFFEVPELRFNRTSIYTGIRWDTFGGGIIEKVEIDTDEEGNELQSGIITLKLPDGDIGAVAVDDLCQGIFHNFGGSNDTVTEDQRNGNFRFAGFNTSYFRITEILESDNSRFRYTLRGVSENWTQQHHPSQFMHFAGYSNPTNPDRQASSYTTPYYTIRLRNMTTWEYGQNNIYEITGKLDGFEVGGEPLQGHGTSIENMYFSGYIREIKNAPIDLVIHDSGDGFLALGESTTLTCKVTHGWNDITDNVDTWSIIRESGNQADDNVWNINHTDFNGIITLTHTKAYSDLGNGISTMFTITAKGNTASGQNFTRETIITI